MSGKSSFDTSILIYVISLGDARAAKAEELLAKGGCISVQVLNEFVAVARRKLKMPWHEVRDALSAIRTLCETPTPLSVATHEAALEIAEQYGYHIYDALILAAALDADCDTLYTEDLQDGQRVGAITIRNPFAIGEG
jgi:predicted nucleic acid-binding protein